MPDGGKFVLCWSCLLVQDALRSRFGSGSRLSSESERETERERRELTCARSLDSELVQTLF